ncbi:MAG: OmpA family protein, partial [Prevotella sp.]|nr:OmpA family protein [Prevotella sp.]MCI6556009.1 OmpA family protein [Prevotella sp.]
TMKKIFVIALTAVLTAMSANAQCCGKEEGKACCGGCKYNPSWFVNFQGGIQLPNTPGMSHLISPVFGLNVGRNISPLFSTRLGIEGCNSKVYNEFTGEKQSFKYATGSFDAMVNLLNLISPKRRALNLYGIAGVGLNWSGMATTNSSKFSPNIRVGAQLDWRVAKNLAFNLEYRADNTNDQFNGRLEPGSHDWYTSLLLGVSLVLPDAKPQVVVKDNSAELKALNDRINALQAENAALKNRKPEVKEVVKTVVDKQTVLPNVFFQCAKSDISTQQAANVKAIADFLKANPNSNVTIKGYASPEGNPEVNQKLSEARAKAVADMLINKLGISADRIKTEAGGATSDIYPVNELNRVAVSIAK